jgi:tRNA (cytidine(34)-2'-O)-methyltransferase
MFHVALFEPEIPPNTGNIARLCAATFTPLHIVGVTGFRMDDRTLKRAGLDYWEHVELHRHVDLDALYAVLPESRFLYFTTKATTIVSCSDPKQEDSRNQFCGPTKIAVSRSRCLTQKYEASTFQTA